MRAVVAWWDLAETGPDVDALRDDLADEGTAAWSQLEGLVLKVWLADPDTGRWGAVMLWEDDAPGRAAPPPNRAAELIGAPPTTRVEFEVAAAVTSSKRGS